MTDEILAFIEARLAEDEQVARAAGWHHPEWTYDRETFTVASAEWPVAARKDRDGRSPINDVDGTHIARHDPARVLREVEAKRRIVRVCEGLLLLETRQGGWHEKVGLTPTRREVVNAASFLRILAVPYDQHPDYREEWRP